LSVPKLLANVACLSKKFACPPEVALANESQSDFSEVYAHFKPVSAGGMDAESIE
jgi:hypothetical protein